MGSYQTVVGAPKRNDGGPSSSDNEIRRLSVVIQRLKIQPTRVSTMLMRMQVASGK
jgi:hypothetical protein